MHKLIAIRFLKHKDERAVLLVNHKYFGQTSFAQNMEKYKVFDRVLAVIEPKNFDEKQHEQFVLDHYNTYFNTYNLSFNCISEIYSACDLNNLFTIYCRLNEKPVSFVEMYDGQFEDDSRYDASTEIFKYPRWLGEMSRKYLSLSGDDTKYTKTRYLCVHSRIQYKDKDINIDLLNSFYNLNAPEKERIIQCIEIPDEIQHDNINLILLNSTKWLHLKTGLHSSKHCLLYLLILDYYFYNRNNILIKNHPHKDQEDYFESKVKHKVNYMPAMIPIEFYGLIDQFHVSRVLSIKSTGAAKIAPFVDEEIQLGQSFLHHYPDIHKVFLSLLIGNHFDCEAMFQTIGINSRFVDCLRQYADLMISRLSNPLSNPSYLKYYIINNVSQDFFELCQLKEAVLFFFDEISLWSTLKPHLFLKKHLIAITIKKEALESHIISDMEEESLWILCMNELVRREIQGLHIEYELLYTGIKIVVCENNEWEIKNL